jgi:hypothetical protein
MEKRWSMDNKKETIMSKIAALLANDEVTEAVTDHLAKLKIEDLTWDLLSKDDDLTRVIPAVAWPAGATGQGTATGIPAGVVTRTDYPETTALQDDGVDGSAADFYAQSIAHGATAIIVDVPHEHRDQVASTLQHAGATRISWE